MLGYATVDEVLKLNMKDVYRSAAERERAIARHRSNGQRALTLEWKRKDGTMISVCLTARIVESEDGGPRCFEGIVEDVTAKRRLDRR